MSSKHFEDIKIKFTDDSDTSVKIIAEPFERGYGVTIGNALRRTLMTSVPGAAIVSVKIDGADHEFSVLKGILEDVSDIILNLKGVIFKIVNDGPETIALSLEGPLEFKAEIKVDRSLYNIKYASKSFFSDLGDKFIDDIFTITLNPVKFK